ncbi:MAG: T9SS type A sorting domain-containing protein [Ignavibacteria bacterium]|nr:T9SS type A sorting domain-containing protein [Ignavibacteria bacterium]
MSKLKLIAALAVIVFVSNTFSQSNGKLPGNEQGFYSTSDGTTPTDKYSVQPKKTNVNPEITKLAKEINVAKTNGDVQKVNLLQNKLNELTGARKQEGTVNSEEQNFIDWSTMDYNVSTVLPWNNWGSAIGVSQEGGSPGVLYAASTQWALAAGDTMTFLTSTNGGQTWTRNWSTNFVSNTDYNANEIDMEIVFDGTNTWAFIVAGYYDYATSNRRCWLWRYNITTNSLTSTQLVFAPNSATNDYYCPRITSDGSQYNAATYVYIITSCDSLFGGTNHWLKQKFCDLESPFGTFTVTYKNANAGGFFYNSQPNPAGKYLSSDIAYLLSPSADRIITSFQVDYGSSANPPAFNIVTAWSDDYGATNTGVFQVAEANPSSGAKISFPGANSSYGMLVYQRQFSGTDWDPYFKYTSNRGTTWSTGDYVDASGDRQRGRVEVYTPYPPVSFRVGYNQEVTSTPQAFLQKYDTTTNTFPSGNKYQVSNVTADTAYGSIRPCKKTGADDCVAIWRGLATAFTYCSYNCATTVGVVNNNQTPTAFDLSQNYPNPFNPSTNIKFAVPVSGMVKLVVYDVTGREAGILLSEQMNAGTYNVSFDASQLSSGIYFYLSLIHI